ncbi:MAG: DNA alkylation repair protein [SAR324 cluster bacterium]|nr:DNA alkylation repair protein [SAR324 cluster bacterium]
MKEGFQFRDVFNATVVQDLAEQIHKTWPEFAKNDFTDSITARLEQFSFGGRNQLIAEQLKVYLPDDFPKAAEILVRSLGPELPQKELTGFDGFMIMPQCKFISQNGLEYFDISINALYEMTKRFSAEGDIRLFIKKYPEKTMKLLHQWTNDANCHVRRLVSEGTRPRLPLYSPLPQFKKDPVPVIELLEKLKQDPELYVRRSVANNLNDIAKDNPHIVVETLKAWSTIQEEGTHWIIRHASRSLVKYGNKEMLSLLGYPGNPKISVHHLHIHHPTIKIGETLQFDLEIQSSVKKMQNLMIDYAIHFVKANGKQVPKVFKLAKKKINNCESLKISKKHSFKPISTRKYYPGEHFLEIIINGDSLGTTTFFLKEPVK